MVDAKIILCMAAVLLSMGMLGASHAEADKFAVIVNSENAFSASRRESIETIRRLYLKLQQDWPNGTIAIGFARPANSEEERAFRKYVLEMGERRLSEHWLRLREKKGVAPPRAVGATSILLRQLRSRTNAFGVVRVSDLSDMSDIRILLVFGEVADE